LGCLHRLPVGGGQCGETAPQLAIKIFASGWLQDGEAWGQPVDVQPLPDGSLLVSDDLAG